MPRHREAVASRGEGAGLAVGWSHGAVRAPEILHSRFRCFPSVVARVILGRIRSAAEGSVLAGKGTDAGAPFARWEP